MKKSLWLRIGLFLIPTIFTFLSLLAPKLQASLASTDNNSWFINMSEFSKSAHGGLSCEVCHGDMKQNGKTHPDLSDFGILLKDGIHTYDYSRCKVCHRVAYARYKKGEHAKALTKENAEPGPTSKSEEKKIKRAPTCGDCHRVHYDKSHLPRVEIGVRMTEVCGTCHLQQRNTYLMDFHGRKAVNLRYEPAAYCTDCHGAHTCASLKDRSKALEVCQKCHPDAGLRFAEFVIHPAIQGLSKEEVAGKAQRVAIIKAISAIMVIIVIIIVAFFYGHSFLWLLRELHEKLRKH